MSPLAALRTHWPVIDALLDEALALPPSERTAWLDRLPGEHAALRDTLARLLAADADAGAAADGVETDDFLRTLPPVPAAVAHALGPATADPGAPAAGALVGPWRLVRPLGDGGMGSVWLAERADGTIRRPVALKLPRLAWMAGLAERMARERDILAALDHPHIARLLDAGVDALGRPWLALEFVDGVPIDTHARAHALTVPARVALLRQVCDAVAYAHARLVVHRDLKPSNILVTADGRVKLLDFGIAKLLEDGQPAAETALTRLAGRALTLDYASPEQVRGEPLTVASDVYSLGVVAFELLAGRRPYRLARGTAAELEQAIGAAEIPAASSLAASPADRRALQGDLDAILWQALRHDPARRYAGVPALDDDLRRHLADEPVAARPEAWAPRAWRFVRRHRGAVAAGTAVVSALAVGTAVATWQAVEASRQRQVALAASDAAEHSRREAERGREAAVRSDTAARLRAAEAERERERADAERRRAEDAARSAAQAAAAARAEAARAAAEARRADLAADAQRRSADEARRAADRAAAARDLLVAAFTQADSTAGAGAQTRAVDVLRAARDQFEQRARRHPIDPLLALELRTALAYSLAGLGQLADARAVLEPGLDAVQGRLPAEDPRRLAALVTLGEIDATDGQPDRAADRLVPALDLLRRGGDPALHVRALRWLSTARIDRRRFDEAQALLDEASQVLEKAGPAVDAYGRATVLSSMANLAVNRRSPDALDRSLAAYAALRDHFAPRRGIEVLSADARVGLALSHAGRRREAVDRLERVVDRLRVVAGPDHPITQASTNYLGNALLAVGDGAGARAVFLGLARPDVATTPPTVPDALNELNLALATWLQRDAPAAAAHAEAAATLGRRVLGDTAAVPRQAATLQALLAAQAGRFEVAESVLRDLAALPDRHAAVVLFEGVIARAVARLRGSGAPSAEDEARLAAAVAPGQSMNLRVLAMLQAGPGIVDRPGAADTWRPRIEALRTEVQQAHDRGSNDVVELMGLEGRVLAALGRPADAVDRLAGARALAATVGSPALVRARLDVDLAAALVAAGRPDRAVAIHGTPASLFARARTVLAGSPLAPDAERVRVAAEALGAPPARDAR